MKIPFLKTKKNDKKQYEKPDPKPAKILSGLNRPPSTVEMVRQVVKAEMSVAAAEREMEIFDEANDFNVEDPEGTFYDLPDDDTFVNNTGFIEETPAETPPEPEVKETPAEPQDS